MTIQRNNQRVSPVNNYSVRTVGDLCSKDAGVCKDAAVYPQELQTQ